MKENKPKVCFFFFFECDVDKFCNFRPKICQFVKYAYLCIGIRKQSGQNKPGLPTGRRYVFLYVNSCRLYAGLIIRQCESIVLFSGLCIPHYC